MHEWRSAPCIGVALAGCGDRCFTIVDACAYSVTKEPWKATYSDAGLRMFAARTFQKVEAIQGYYGTLVYHSLSFKEHTRKRNDDAVLMMDLARSSKYLLQIEVHEDGLSGLLRG